MNKVIDQLEKYASNLASSEAQGYIESAIDEISRLQHNTQVLKNALWKACGDNEEIVNATIDSQGQLL